MQNIWRKLSTTAALAIMLCLTGLVMSGTVLAQQCVDNGDGTVTDNLMGFMWQKAAAGPMNWNAAMSYTSGLSLGGHSDWWLPSKSDLVNLYHSPCNSIMDVASSHFWSSTTEFRANPISAWRVSLHCGNVSLNDMRDSYFVRAVRDAQ